MHTGEFAAAAALLTEAEAINQVTGTVPLRYTSLMLAAWRGREAQTVELMEASLHDATTRGEGRVIVLAEYSTAVLDNGLCRYEAALAAAQRACAYDIPGLFGFALVELAEASTRSDRPELAADAVRGLGEHTRASGTQAGPGHPCPHPGTAQPRAGGRGPVPGGPRPAGPAPAAPCIWPEPTSSTGNGCAGRTAGSTPGTSCAPPTTFSSASGPRGRRAHPPRAPRDRGDGAQTRRRDVGRAHRAGGADRPAGPRRAHQSGDRRRAVPQPPHRRMAPWQGNTSCVTAWRRCTNVANNRSTKTSLYFAPAPGARRRGPAARRES